MLFFLDLETTGLNPFNDAILEFAIAEVDPRTLDPLRGLSCVLRCEKPKALLNMDPYVRDMHTANGLLGEVGNAQWEPAAAYRELREWIGGAPGEHTLAGDSVHFDRDFLRWNAPSVCDLFSHRLLDVSAFMVARKQLGLEPCPIIGDKQHRAQPDVLCSIAKAKWHLSRVIA